MSYRRPPKPRSLRFQLAALTLGLVIPTLAFVGVLLWQLAASERIRVEDETRALSRGFAVAVDREINGVLTTLQALATSPSLQARDFEGFYRQASDVARSQGINISLRDFNGKAVMTTRAPFGSSVGVPPILAETDQTVLRSMKPVVSNIFTSTIADRPVFQIMTAPVIVSGVPSYVLGASIDVEYLADAIRREHLPVGWFGAIIDRNGTFVARTEQHDRWAGKSASADFRTKAASDFGSYYGTNSTGQTVLAGYAKSSLTGWTTAASLPTELLYAPIRRYLVALIILGLILGLIAAGIALFVGRRISDAFSRLSVGARSIGSGDQGGPIATSIAEVNHVGLALHAAALQLRQRSAERDEAEAQLRSLNETLEQKVEEQTRDRNRLWETSNDLVASCADDGRLITINPAWESVLGWTRAELISRPLSEFVSEPDRSAFRAFMEAESDPESDRRASVRLICKSGESRSVTFSLVRESGSEIAFLVGRDMTEQRFAEDALRQSQKMEALGQLTGGIAHDFNNMLAVVMGTLDLMGRRLDRGDTNVGKYLEGALDGARRAASLTQRLLAFARQQPLSPETIDANRLIAGMADLLNRTLGENNRIETVLSAGLWPTSVDPSQLENLLLNLAVNARDAMPDGGRLTIETANAHVDLGYAREHRIASGQYVLLAVTDTGCGMSPEIIAKAFDPFFTTKAVGQGTGLGLSQVFGVARQSGGHVKIYSEVGHGTTIKLYLPRASGSPQTASKKPTFESDHHKFVPATIMVVEDEDRVRDFAVEALKDLGYTVLSACSGPDALRTLAAGRNMDLLLTDIVMPEMTGRQLVDAVRKAKPEMRVLYMTGYSRNAIVHNGVLDPGTNLLTKPFTVDQLADAIATAIYKSSV